MLTKDLLDVNKRRPNVTPVYRDPKEYTDVAENVIDAYEEGKQRHEVQEAVSELETHDDFKFVRGLSALLERRSTFEQQAPVDPQALREVLYRRGYVTDEADRDGIVQNVAKEYGIDPDEVEDAFWADRDEHEVLVNAASPDPTELVQQYNLSLTQTLLFDALELRFTADGNFQEIFGLLKYLGLMYTVDEDLTVHVTGPAALFKKTRKYGTSMAKLLPAILKADAWSVDADVETEVSGEKRVYQFEMDDSRADLFPETTVTEAFDSAVEEDFADRLKTVVDGWEITREPTILRTGNTVMVPDFSFTRNGTEFYLEVVGFWTPDYLEEKIRKVQEVETDSDKAFIVAVDENLNCTKQDFAGADEVIVYDKQIPIKPVVDRMNALEQEQQADEYEQLLQEQPTVPDGHIAVQDVAAEWDVQEEAAEQYIQEYGDGIISAGTYLPQHVSDELASELAELDDMALSRVQKVLTDYNVGTDVLEDLGYTIKWTSLDQSSAVVKEKE